MSPLILTNQYLGCEKSLGSNLVTTKVNFEVQKCVPKMGENDFYHKSRELSDTFWTSKYNLFHFCENTATKRYLKSGSTNFPHEILA